MKKHYTRPVFRYLDFLGDRDVPTLLTAESLLAAPEAVQLQSDRKE
jgi:hypothetical protein